MTEVKRKSFTIKRKKAKKNKKPEGCSVDEIWDDWLNGELPGQIERNIVRR